MKAPGGKIDLYLSDANLKSAVAESLRTEKEKNNLKLQEILIANREHLEILKQGVSSWNEWRKRNPNIYPDLRDANLSDSNFYGYDLKHVEFHRTNLISADLRRADLCGASFGGADLSYANLSYARLSGANLIQSNFTGAIFVKSQLYYSVISENNLSNADFGETVLFKTHFSDVDLSGVNGLSKCRHEGQ